MDVLKKFRVGIRKLHDRSDVSYAIRVSTSADIRPNDRNWTLRLVDVLLSYAAEALLWSLQVACSAISFVLG